MSIFLTQGFPEFQVGVLGKEDNQSWQLSGLSSTYLQIAVIHRERIVLMTRNMKMRCEILLLHFSLMDHYLLGIHQVLAEGYIHSLFIRKLLDICALRNFNGKKNLFRNQTISRLVSLNFLYQLGFLSLRIKRK